ncbi:iron ABC transporter permease [Rossellomorea aquimaris]|uniref:FecCD family ABC transporter permease n=1 Tax=Rossellomorea aquimaris TaxID=189382 RepID=UPI001CD3F71A|nr:iron ABC transporter permease [Rossellomorea aquimaris]MCA1053930.1 iron ABC transporter permease [Rossellomorea aquimaris]
MPNLFIRRFLQNRIWIGYLLAFGILILSLLIGISIGTVNVPIIDIIRIIGSKLSGVDMPDSIDPMHSNIVFSIRLPRVLLALIVGSSLAVAGASFQGLLRNPLADPYTLGMSSGASVGAVITLFFHISLPYLGLFTLPVISILCSLITVFLVLAFARKVDRSMKVETIILTGIIFSSFLGSVISLMIALSGEELRQIIGWLLGSVSMRGWDYIYIVFPFFIAGSVLLLFNAKELNGMSFGEEQARHIGISVQKRKYMILIAGSTLTGAAVAVSGTIGFVGLVIPHFIRRIIGYNHQHVLPLSIISGGAFLVVADLLSRTVINPAELPIGVITALIGAPIFAYILLKKRGG